MSLRACVLLMVSAISIALAGCRTRSGADTVRVGDRIPPLTDQERETCRDPGAKAGQPARTVIANTRFALGVCSRKHQDVVKKYDNVRTLFGSGR